MFTTKSSIISENKQRVEAIDFYRTSLKPVSSSSAQVNRFQSREQWKPIFTRVVFQNC